MLLPLLILLGGQQVDLVLRLSGAAAADCKQSSLLFRVKSISEIQVYAFQSASLSRVGGD